MVPWGGGVNDPFAWETRDVLAVDRLLAPRVSLGVRWEVTLGQKTVQRYLEIRAFVARQTG